MPEKETHSTTGGGLTDIVIGALSGGAISGDPLTHHVEISDENGSRSGSGSTYDQARANAETDKDSES